MHTLIVCNLPTYGKIPTIMNQPADRHDKVLAVVNRKGGVAKTTTAINLAHGLSRKLMRRVAPKDVSSISDPSNLYQYQDTHYYLMGHVLLIDFDPQGHCARGLGIDTGKADIGDVLLEQRHITEAVVSADRAEDSFPRPNLWILPASDNLEKAKDILRAQAFAMPSTKNYGLVRILEARLKDALERFDYIILDCPPALDTFTQAVYQFADSAIVPVKPDYFSMAGTGQHISSIIEAQTRGIDIRIHTIVPTLNVLRQKLDQRMVEELREKYGEMVSQPIPRSQAVAEAPAFQQTIFEYDARFLNPATIAYQALVDRVYYG
ncbi:Chromosome (plasmid) partitioning protein ParA [hydrothermal vent metagenome]|uniref:Chromosome (Plasmid) partitioning protein ParA n=1 Tax=hydrothermal vent metagenome TaxID=652676 RepID=A0A3B0V6C5_9ZZZZ